MRAVRGVKLFVAALAVVAVVPAAASALSVTLGRTDGQPQGNICAATITCTYLPLVGASVPGGSLPALRVPFDGTVTSFSVNSASGTGIVRLRVLRPDANGEYTGVGTSPLQTLDLGVTTFAVSLPVQQGDVLGLDNPSSAVIFATSDPTAVTAFYELPPLIDGITAAPNHTQGGYRLLLSATVESRPASISQFKQAHKTWRRTRKRGPHKAPVGTAFSFRLDQQASGRLLFERVKGRRAVPAGTAKLKTKVGANKVRFSGRLSNGKRLRRGRYTVQLKVSNESGDITFSRKLAFRIVA